jgi:23S rRNA (adenine2503-C2)-methyltransferase
LRHHIILKDGSKAIFAVLWANIVKKNQKMMICAEKSSKNFYFCCESKLFAMLHTEKEPLYGKTLTRLQSICTELGLPRFAAKQIARWLYVRRVTDFAQMTDLSLKARTLLSEKYELGLAAPLKESCSADGTKKYLFRTSQGEYIESAYIPDKERATLCVSSQAGCRMGCRFCATGRQGLQHSLSTNEIINQILSIPESERLTNLVFMGMGEPLDNIENVLEALEIITSAWGMAWSPTRVTLSTAGVAKNLRRFLNETKVHLAVSLHNPFPQERKEIMPIENAYPIREIADILREYDFTGQRRVSFEYIVMEGLNDSPAHIKELCRLLDGIKCRMNLIRFHKIPDSPYFSPSDEKMIRFRDTLTAKGIQTTIRASRGEDIKAACGLLSTAEQAKKEQ